MFLGLMFFVALGAIAFVVFGFYLLLHDYLLPVLYFVGFLLLVYVVGLCIEKFFGKHIFED
jgi:hypothetical protein